MRIEGEIKARDPNLEVTTKGGGSGVIHFLAFGLHGVCQEAARVPRESHT